MSSVAYSAKTLLGMKNTLCSILPITFTPNMDCTLNSKYSVYQAVTPSEVPKIRYYGIGIGGKYNVTDTDLSEAYKPSMKDMDLYVPIPFRCLAEDEDSLLTSTERAKYRMRVLTTINGVKYYCYYLKALEYTDEMYFSYVDPDTNQEVVYTLDATNLRPTGTKPSTSGVTDVTTTDISAYAIANVVINNEEIAEAVNILYNGDLRRCVISELGIYTGIDSTVEALDYQSVRFSYLESVYTQLATKHTWNGTDLSQAGSYLSSKVCFTDAGILVSSS